MTSEIKLYVKELEKWEVDNIFKELNPFKGEKVLSVGWKSFKGKEQLGQFMYMTEKMIRDVATILWGEKK